MTLLEDHARPCVRGAAKKGLALEFKADISRIDKAADGSLPATLKDGCVLATDCVFCAAEEFVSLRSLSVS